MNTDITPPLLTDWPQEAEHIDALASTGQTVAVDPDIADQMGAFEENALSDEDVQMSLLSVDPVTGQVQENGDLL